MKIQDFHRQNSHLTDEHFSLKEKKKSNLPLQKNVLPTPGKTGKKKKRNTLLALKQHSVTPTESEMRCCFSPRGPHSLLGKLNM